MYSSRKLAAIMFTDIAGYTSLMGADEKLAFDLLNKNRKMQRPLIENFGGTWVKELGDGVLASFESATDSVLCAAAILHAGKGIEGLQLRIGIHLGEVVFENSDVFGDGVNIASRIQSAAPVGSIYISEAVNKNIVNKKGIKTAYVGEEILKHVKEPIHIYAVSILENEMDYLENSNNEKRPQVNKTPHKSIAVLPFVNMSNDPEQEYFSDGMAEEILNTLSNLKELKVVGRTSSFQFKGKNTDLRQVGEILQVATVLEGSVRRQGSKLRITAQLINVADGFHLWSERYDMEMTDVFAIQDDISTKIAEKLKVTFFGTVQSKADNAPTLNMEAYELVLQGRFYVEKFIEGFEKALVCFNRALELDPNYAEAYAEMARIYFLFTMQLFYPPRIGFEKAKLYAEKALGLNKNLGGAHYVLGQIYFWYFWDWDNAKKEYELAEHASVSYYFTGIVIDPWYPAFLYGDFDGALNATQKVMETDPLSFFSHIHLGYFNVYGRHTEVAEKVLNNILQLAPSFSEAERLLAINYSFAGENDKALVHARKAAAMAQGKGWAQNFLIIALAKSGLHAEARSELAKWKSNAYPYSISPVGVSIIHTHLGDFNKAFECLEEAIEYRDFWMISLKYSPEYDLLRSDPRFVKFLELMRFP